jgi:putative ABC transport system substrate-binding protein
VFRKALNEAGYVEGQNVMVEAHWLDGQYDRLPALMAELVRSRVAVIVTPGFGAGARAAKAATTTIPIVFGVAEDPVKLGLVASLARPGGNATGINLLSAEIGAKRLGLLHDLVPKAVRIAVLVNPGSSSTAEATLRDIPEAARALGLQIQVLRARHQPRDRSSLRHPHARPGRCSLRRPRRVLHQPARPIRDARGAPCDSRGLFQS